MIHDVVTELSAIVYFTTCGMLYALLYRTGRLFTTASRPLVKHIVDFFSALTGGVIFIVGTEFLFGGVITFYSAIIYILTSFLWVYILSKTDFPSALFITKLKSRISELFKFRKLKSMFKKPKNEK